MSNLEFQRSHVALAPYLHIVEKIKIIIFLSNNINFFTPEIC